MSVSGIAGVLTTDGEREGRCASPQSRVLILEQDPVHRRVMRRLLGLMGFAVSSTAEVDVARQVLLDHPVTLVVVGCRCSDELADLLGALSLPGHINLVVVSSQKISCFRRGFTFIRRPCSWSALRRAIEQNVRFAV